MSVKRHFRLVETTSEYAKYESNVTAFGRSLYVKIPAIIRKMFDIHEDDIVEVTIRKVKK